MDMSIPVGAAGRNRRLDGPDAKMSARSPNSSDLDAWLEKHDTT